MVNQKENMDEYFILTGTNVPNEDFLILILMRH